MKPTILSVKEVSSNFKRIIKQIKDKTNVEFQFKGDFKGHSKKMRRLWNRL